MCPINIMNCLTRFRCSSTVYEPQPGELIELTGTRSIIASGQGHCSEVPTHSLELRNISKLNTAQKNNPIELNKELITAISDNDFEAIDALLQKGADINHTERNFSPLLMVVRSGKTEMAQFLLEKGANVNYKAVGYTPLTAAVSDNNTDMAQILLKYKADVVCNEYYPPVLQAIIHNNVKMVEILLKYGADVNTIYGAYDSGLMTAIKKKDINLVVFLLDHGADVNYYSNSETDSPLKIAMDFNEAEIVFELLIKNVKTEFSDSKKLELFIKDFRADPRKVPLSLEALAYRKCYSSMQAQNEEAIDLLKLPGNVKKELKDRKSFVFYKPASQSVTNTYK